MTFRKKYCFYYTKESNANSY